MYTREEYEAKRNARYERLLDAADKANQEGQSTWDAAQKMASIIPMGQPILIGHYSEKGDRNYRERIDNKRRKGYDLIQKSHELRNRANGMINNNAIFSDDPDASEKLDNKVEKLEEKQAYYKAINKAHTDYLKNPASLDKCDLSDGDKNMIRNFKPEYSWQPHPIAPYQFTNLSATIRTAKKRAEIVEKKQSAPDKDEEINGIRIEWRGGENQIRIFYPAHVDLETFKKLKQHGYRVLRTAGEGAFSAYYNNNAAYFVQELRER